MLLAGLSGCPRGSPSTTADSPKDQDATSPSATTPSTAPEQFRRTAHAQALAALREQIRPTLRALDPVTAARVEGTALGPPRFGPTSRAERRSRLQSARREAEGIRAPLLSPEDGMVLRVLLHALARGDQHLRRPPWRDGPRAVLYALGPYVHALHQGVIAGTCDDGCGVDQLAVALRTGLAEVGSASPPTVTAAREDLRRLASTLERLSTGLSPEHPLVRARPQIEAELTQLDATLATASEALATARELPWDRAVAPAPAAQWARRPTRWDAPRLRAWLEIEEAYGRDPSWLIQRIEATLSRLRSMIERDRTRGTEDRPVPRPLDARACATVWAPLQAWAQERKAPLVAALDCDGGFIRTLPASVDTDTAFVRALIEQGIVEPSRRARIAQTAPEIAMVTGRAARVGQSTVMQIAVAAGPEGYRGVELAALESAHASLCLAATAVWIHGELGDDDRLASRLAAHDCGDIDELVAAAQARPRAALTGLGLTLLGTGPADAAALDRYFWAPMGLVRDLAQPPPSQPRSQPEAEVRTKIETLTPSPPSIEGPGEDTGRSSRSDGRETASNEPAPEEPSR